MYTNLQFDSAAKTVLTTIQGRVDSTRFRALALEELALLEEKKAHKLIIDIAGLGVMRVEDQQWLQKEWNAKAVKAGLKHLAFVIPKDVFGKVAMQKANSDVNLNDKITIKYFENVEKAKDWINQF